MLLGLPLFIASVPVVPRMSSGRASGWILTMGYNIFKGLRLTAGRRQRNGLKSVKGACCAHVEAMLAVSETSPD